MHAQRRAVAFLTIGLAAPLAFALDGQTPLEFTPYNITGADWRILELYTGGNTITSIADAGYTQKVNFDGIGAYAHDASTVRVLFNHELTTSASVSYLDLNRTNVRNWIAAGTTTPSAQAVTRIGPAYTSISGSNSLARFCSSVMFEPNRFGAGNGFATRAYMTGEEVAGGSVYAIDSDPASSTYRTMFECTALPTGSWENVAQFNTGRTDKVGLVLFEDAGSNTTTGTAPLRLWIGNKRDVDNNGSLSFLEKNGLAEGTVYYWVPSGSGTAAPSRFTSTGQAIAGTWSTSSAGAMLFSKLEDGVVSPDSGTKLAFNCQDQGTFTLDLSVAFNGGGTLNTAASAATVKMILEETNDGGSLVSFNSQDNLDWSTSSLLFTQEDGSNQEIWQINPSSLSATLDAIAIARVSGGAGESSGIVDVSSLFGYVPGSLLLTNSLSGTLADNQMVLMISPNAQLIPEPAMVASVMSLVLIAARRRRR